jgi:hypothetical protein
MLVSYHISTYDLVRLESNKDSAGRQACVAWLHEAETQYNQPFQVEI